MHRVERFDASTTEGRQRAADRLATGALVALPTETVYGLAARCDREDAVQAIYRAKERPSDRTLALLVADLEQAQHYWADGPWMRHARALAQAHWPGPLTLIAPAREATPSWLVSADGRIGLRCPAQPNTLDILRRLGSPVVCPSANRSDDPSPTSPQAVLQGLASSIDAIAVDDCPMGGMESTIIAFTADGASIVRAGAIARETLQRTLGPALHLEGPVQRAPQAYEGAKASAGPRLPGRETSAAAPLLWIGPTAEAPACRFLLPSNDLDEAFQQIHAFLSTIPASLRHSTRYQIAPALLTDARVDGLIRVLERYLS